MEYVGINTTHDDLVEAVKGTYGKDVLTDCSFAYCGTVVFGFGKNTEILDKNCKCKHYDWKRIGDDVYISILK